MARKKLAEFENAEGTHKACVYRDAEWQEYRVCFYRNGVKQTLADYHDNDKQAAYTTAAAYVWPDITPEMLAAVDFYRERMGSKWKAQLQMAWWLNEYSFFPFNDKAALLHQLRNIAGPAWLAPQPNKF